MCTAISYKSLSHYFGRTLDLDHAYVEEVTVAPRLLQFPLRNGTVLSQHYAIIGMATVVCGYPLYYDGMNEFGLAMAGLNFPGNAVYQKPVKDRINITPFELIPWILGQCKTVEDARRLLQKCNLCNIPFSEELPLSPMHWMISDKERSIVVEPLAEGLRIYDNPVDVLANNPPFDYHLHNINQYMNVTAEIPDNRFSAALPLVKDSLGMGGIGLPGDLSSPSRFVRAAFARWNSQPGKTVEHEIGQFFHLMDSVFQIRGNAKTEGGFEETVYTSCMDTGSGIYYYITYDNRQICCVDMRRENLNGNTAVSFPLLKKQNICCQN